MPSRPGGCQVVALLTLAAALILACAPARAGVVIQARDGSEAVTYAGSHALLIGQSAYANGWARLDSVPQELAKVEEALKQQDFSVETVRDADAAALSTSIKDFIDRYGYNKDNRLLIYFSGHGYSRRDNQMGYIVGVDAPAPGQDESALLRKSVSMSQVQTWCKEMEARHVLFVFDSCFSGTIFKTRAAQGMPEFISRKASRPVRQFITAGSASEEVPAKSVFTPLFVRGIDGEADLDKDGYITAVELGHYLQRQVSEAVRNQTPQYGKMLDPEFNGGEFVFAPSSLRKQVEEKQKQHKEFLRRQAEELAKFNCKWMIAGLVYGFDRMPELFMFAPESDFGSTAKAAFNLENFTVDRMVYDKEKIVALCQGHVVLPDSMPNGFPGGRVDGVGLGTIQDDSLQAVNALKSAMQNAYNEFVATVFFLPAHFVQAEQQLCPGKEAGDSQAVLAEKMKKLMNIDKETKKQLMNMRDEFMYDYYSDSICDSFSFLSDERNTVVDGVLTPRLTCKDNIVTGTLRGIQLDGLTLEEAKKKYYDGLMKQYVELVKLVDGKTGGARIPPYAFGIRMETIDMNAAGRSWGWDESGNAFVRFVVDHDVLRKYFNKDEIPGILKDEQGGKLEVVGSGAKTADAN